MRTQRCSFINVDIYACFIDYFTASNMVRPKKLIKILKIKGVDEKAIRIIKELYRNQVAEIKVKFVF